MGQIPIHTMRTGKLNQPLSTWEGFFPQHNKQAGGKLQCCSAAQSTLQNHPQHHMAKTNPRKVKERHSLYRTKSSHLAIGMQAGKLQKTTKHYSRLFFRI